MKSVAAIINYNSPQFIAEQVWRIKRYLRPDNIVVFDNSTPLLKLPIKDATLSAGAKYRPIVFKREGDYSRGHAMALNSAYIDLKVVEKYDIIGLFDHDVFPFKRAALFEQAEDFSFCGLKQVADGKEYLHPGYLFINTNRVKDDLDFMPVPGMDTGGQLHKLINDSNSLAFSYKLSDELGYEIISDCMMHFVKGSNWQGMDKDLHEQRIKALFNKLRLMTE